MWCCVIFVILHISISTHTVRSGTDVCEHCDFVDISNMDFEKSLYHSLYNKLAKMDIDETTIHVSKRLYRETLRKSRTASHLKFLRTCLRKNLIPKGFKLNFHGKPQCKNILQSCSRRLMRQTMHQLDQEQLYTSDVITNLRNTLRTICPLSQDIRFKIHCLNSEFFHHIEAIKTKKLKSLGLRLTNKNTTDDDKSVVTIPNDLPLDPAGKSILAKGLKFIPARRACHIQLEEDLERFYRRLRLHAHFNQNYDDAMIQLGDNDDNEEDGYFNKFQPKIPKTWTPSEGAFASLDLFIHKTRTDIAKIKDFHKQKFYNCTSSELTALRNLQRRDDIVIKPADKGGATVVWRKDLYIAEGQKQLSNQSYYKKLTKDITEDNNKTVSKVVNSEIKNKHLPKEAVALVVKKPACSKFYLLPKIHKPDIPGRPIISNQNCPTEHISHFLSDLLLPIVSSQPSYIQDTTDFLAKISNFKFDTPHDQAIFTMDVQSLYTVIPNDAGLKALEHFLNKRSSKNPPTSTLLRLAELVLTLSCFSFNSEYYQQIGGVCMGTRMGPPYACLFMAHLEQQILQSFVGKVPSLYVRFIDDIFCAGNMSSYEIDKFVTYFGNYNPHIKLTHVVDNPVVFLDTTLSTTQKKKISTSIFYKPTDSHSYLNYHSSHPKQCRDNIP
jgi:hypothetical protein